MLNAKLSSIKHRFKLARKARVDTEAQNDSNGDQKTQAPSPITVIGSNGVT